MYAVGTDHPLKQPCVRILEMIAKRRMQAVTDAEVLQELLHRYTAIGQRKRAVEVCNLFIKVVPDIFPVTSIIMEKALELHLKLPQLQARDSLHAAIILDHDIPYIVSADRHFDHVEDFDRLDPSSF